MIINASGIQNNYDCQRSKHLKSQNMSNVAFGSVELTLKKAALGMDNIKTMLSKSDETNLLIKLLKKVARGDFKNPTGNYYETLEGDILQKSTFDSLFLYNEKIGQEYRIKSDSDDHSLIQLFAEIRNSF